MESKGKMTEIDSLFILQKNELFPDPVLHPGRIDDEFGLYAIGGEISSKTLLDAYQKGIFPWYAFKESDIPHWYCPETRFVIFPEEIHISHSMRTLLNKSDLEVSFNSRFHDVIEKCASIDHRDDDQYSWLGPHIINAYTELFKEGYAGSVEVTKNGNLVGGLYGVHINGVFAGESMFSEIPSASKIALISLAKKMAEEGGKFIDCQFETPHLKSMGARHISYLDYRIRMGNLPDSAILSL